MPKINDYHHSSYKIYLFIYLNPCLKLLDHLLYPELFWNFIILYVKERVTTIILSHCYFNFARRVFHFFSFFLLQGHLSNFLLLECGIKMILFHERPGNQAWYFTLISFISCCLFSLIISSNNMVSSKAPPSFVSISGTGLLTTTWRRNQSVCAILSGILQTGMENIHSMALFVCEHSCDFNIVTSFINLL